MDNEQVSKEQSSSGQYRATSNLNIAMENPQININNATGFNIENAQNPDDFNKTSEEDSSDSFDNDVAPSFNDQQIYQSNIAGQTSDSSLDEVSSTSVYDGVSNYSSFDNSLIKNSRETDIKKIFKSNNCTL